MCTGVHITQGYIYYCHNASSLRSRCRAQRDTHNTAAILEGGTHITSDMCIPTHIKSYMCTGIHISRGYIYYCDKANSVGNLLQRLRGIHKIWQPYWKGVQISLVICVSPTHITSNMCTGVHILRGYIYCSHNASSLRNLLQSPRGIHITRQPYWKGVHISQVICVRWCTYDGDTYTIETMPAHYIVAAEPRGDTALLEGGTHITSDMCNPNAYHK